MSGEIGLSAAARAQAVRSYKFWSIYLVLRLRQLEHHALNGTLVIGQLPTSHRNQHNAQLQIPDITLLRDYNIALPNSIHPICLPTIPISVEAESHYFHVGTSLKDSQCAVLNGVRVTRKLCEYLEFARTAAAHQWYLKEQCLHFNRLLADVGVEIAFQAAATWSLINGGQPQLWQPVESADLSHFLPAPQATNKIKHGSLIIEGAAEVTEVDFNGF